MRFVVDECTGPSVARWLAGHGHDVLSIHAAFRGADDEDILARAVRENRVLVTNDKDFGDLVFRDGRAHAGVILLRLADERPTAQIGVLDRILQRFAGQIEESFIVATEEKARLVEFPRH